MACGHNKDDKNKILVIMGATGTGKSQLSIDLSLHFPSEIINADKIQVYRGLDITTNKTPLPDRRGVPHHLLGHFDPSLGEISPLHFRSLASSKITGVHSRLNLPIVVGGSNSFIHALVSDRCELGFGCGPAEFRYRCCFLWVDVSSDVLSEYLSRRVDDMLDMGMFEELAGFFLSGSNPPGLRKAIGVPEFEHYFKCFGGSAAPGGDLQRKVAFEEAVDAIKQNTCRLAERQLGKIQRLRSTGWNLHRLDATEAFRAAMASDTVRSRDVWVREVVGPSLKIVRRFLDGGL